MAPFPISKIVVATIIPLLLNVSWSSVTATITRNNANWGFNKFGNRNLARGEEWVEQKNRESVTDNIFVHDLTDKECSCERRGRRKLGVGKCECDGEEDSTIQYIQYGDSYSSSKSSKSSSHRGKGHSSASEKSKGSKKSKSSSKSEKSVKGRSDYDDDYVYPTQEPTFQPTAPSATTPTKQPSEVDQPSGGRMPTKEPTFKPTSRPTGGGLKCKVDSNGLYGEKVGIANEFRFLYTTQVIPTVTVQELNLDMLPKVEVRMGNEALPKLFPGDCARQGSVSAVTARKRGNNRQLQQISSLNGMSIKPRDTVDEGGKHDQWLNRIARD